AERAAGWIVVRDVPVRMVEDVERFGAELHLLTAGQRHALAHAEIEVPRRRVAQQVSRLDAERPGGRPRERRRIEPLRRRSEWPRIHGRIADQIPELIA